jgi:hypothetical protein
VIRVGLRGDVVRVVDFFLVAFLSFGSFALAAKRSSLATCLAAATPRLSEPDPCPTIAENNSEMRGRGEVFFGGTRDVQ